MTKAELQTRVAARKTEITGTGDKITTIKAQIEALGSAPTLSKLTAFLKTLKELFTE